MNPFRILASIAVTASLVVGISLAACKTGAPSISTTPPPSAAGHKMGLAVNNVSDIGYLVVETGAIEWPQTTTSPDAAQTIAESPMGLVGPGPNNIPISSCYYHTQSSLTASQTAFATINIYKRNGFPGDSSTTQTLIAQLATVTNSLDAGIDASTPASGSWYAFENVAVPPLANAYVSPGDAITFSLTKNGAGVVVPIGQVACFTSAL